MKVEVCKAGRVDVIRFGKDLRLWYICTALVHLYGFVAKERRKESDIVRFFCKNE